MGEFHSITKDESNRANNVGKIPENLVEKTEAHVVVLLLRLFLLLLLLGGGWRGTTGGGSSGRGGTTPRWDGRQLLRAGGDDLLERFALECVNHLG